MVNVKTVAQMVSELALLKFFPADPGARTAMVRTFCEMASSEEQVRYVVRKALGLFNEWPGMMTLRAIFCERFKPRDGIMAYPDAEQFPNGFPPDKPPESKPPLPLPPGHAVSADRELERPLAALAELKSITPARRPMRVPDIPVNPNAKPVTQADVDRAVQELRDKRARQELNSSTEVA